MHTDQPWAACLLTDVLVSYLEDRFPTAKPRDYSALFRGIEGFEVPADPNAFLRHPSNWVPLPVLRELLTLAERTAGRKDVAYLAARSYFEEKQGELPSLFEIIFRALNDIRATFVCAHHWAAVHTNYLKLQCFDRADAASELTLLAQFSSGAQPTIGSVCLLRGMAEGFPRLYPFIRDSACVEEISQLRLEDLASEFPGTRVQSKGDEVVVLDGAGRRIAEGRRIGLRSELIQLPADAQKEGVATVIPVPPSGRIRVLTAHEETDAREMAHAPTAWRIVRGGTITAGGLSHALHEGQLYGAPYARFRFTWTEGPRPAEPVARPVREEVSALLFQYLQHVRQTHTRLVQQQIEKGRLLAENRELRREIAREYGFAGLIGQSKAMQELFGLMRAIAETDVTVLIEGETGTGKELIARALHVHSSRSNARFVAVNCGALAETLLQSELFGHEKGAFTGADARRKGIFEVADGGTLFLDEIGEISPATQVKLLRVLQDGEFQRVGGSDPIRVNVRVLSATNQRLEALVKAGRFRQDLFYRLNVFPIRVPPLRERREDIPLLVAHFIKKSNPQVRKQIRGASSEAVAALYAHDWPGNVRELENVVQRMMVLAAGDTLEWAHLPSEIRGEKPVTDHPQGLRSRARASAEIAERQTIVDALAKTGGNVTRAAKLLAVSRATLQSKMKAYRLRDSQS